MPLPPGARCCGDEVISGAAHRLRGGRAASGPRKRGRRGLSFVEVALSVVILGIAAIALSATFSISSAEVEAADDLSFARAIAQRQINLIDSIAHREVSPDGRRVEGAADDFSVALTSIKAANGDFFPDIWATSFPRYQLRFDSATDRVNLDGSNPGSLDRISGVYILPETNGWHILYNGSTPNLQPGERAAIQSRSLGVRVMMLPLDVAATAVGGVCCQVSPYTSPQLYWIMQIDVTKSAQVIHRLLTFGI